MDVQHILNGTICWSTNTSPFVLLIGMKMKNREEVEILKEEEFYAIM